MKKAFNENLRALCFAIVALTIATACTKNKESMNKVGANYGLTAQVRKSYFLGKTFHLSRGIEDADSQNDVGATPGMSEDFGLVQARITETELQFISTFDPQGREGTMKIIASYPITKQFDIIQDKNDFGESTNKTVEDESQIWSKRAYMRVDWTKPSTSLSKFSVMLRMMSGEFAQEQANANKNVDDSGDTGSVEENTTLLEEPAYDPGHFNFLVETSVKGAKKGTYVFPQSWTTAQAYRVVYRTHLLEVKPSDFKPLPYSLADFGRFGFFFTQQNFIDPHGILESNQKIYANVHNVCEAGGQGSCATNKIRWVLSNDFPEKYKPVARRVVQQWNDVFKADLNRKDDVVYLDESTQATISDPSQNVLAFYPSRTKSGLLGVAQWVSDPRTGEFVGVRATIYGDGIDYVVARVDDLINILAAKASGQDPLAAVFGTSANGTASGEQAPYSDKYVAKQFAANQAALGLDKRHAPSNLSVNGKTVSLQNILAGTREAVQASPVAASIRLAQFAAASPQTFQVQEMSVLGQTPPETGFPSTVGGVAIPSLGGLEQSLFIATKLQDDKDRLLRDAALGIHGTELVEDAAVRRLLNYTKNHTLQDLVTDREKIEADIAEQTFYTTALHEMGHAFGLRHNFAGSADKNHYADEYYAIKQEIKEGKDASGKPTSHVQEDLDPYMSSSIMDYGRDFYAQEAGLGPYDRAAIKYAYNRSVDRKSDTELNPPQAFMFCTDHQVNEKVWCRRFDKGANASEITRNNILYYNTNFVRMHYRAGRLSENVSQGWGSPWPLMSSLIDRVFLPTRLVMDELLYSFMVTEKVPGQNGLCALKFIYDSVQEGELADLCSGDSRQAMEAAHVDPMNPIGTLSNALFVYDPQTGRQLGLRKPSSEYIPNGLADLLFANMEAQNFFATVIGAPEPGSYIAMPSKAASGEQILKLMPLDDSLSSVGEKLKAFASANGIRATPDVLKQMEALVTSVNVGGYGRQLESVVSINGGFTRTEVIGSWWDKYAALIALQAQGMPVTKYRVAKMGGNPYFFPQSHDFMTSLFGKIITRDNAIATIPVPIHDPSGANPNLIEVQAVAPAAINIDLISLSTTFALTGLVLDTDRSMAEKLRICNINEGQCAQGADGQATAQVHSAADGNIYKAMQNADGDSIAYKLVASAQALDDQRAKVIKARDDANKNQPASLMALDNSKDLRDKIIAGIAKDEPLATFVDPRTKKPIDLKAIVQSAWDDLTVVTNSLKTSQRFTAMGMAQRASSNLSVLEQMVDQRLASLGDAGQCWAKDHPMILSTPPVAPPTIIDLSPVISHFGADAKSVVKAAAANAPTSLCQDPKSGEVLQNLQGLKADLTTANAMITTVVTNDITSIAAPIQLGLISKQIHNKETDILRIRELLQKMLPD